MLFLDYPVTRPLRLSRWGAALFYLLAVLAIAVVTVINTVAVGYDPVVFTSTEFNATTSFWYDSFIPKVWRPQGRYCAPATIKIAEYISVVRATGTPFNTGFYSLNIYADNTTGIQGIAPGMIYNDSSLEDCAIQKLTVAQVLWGSSDNEVWVTCNTSANQFILLEQVANDITAGMPTDGAGPFSSGYLALPDPDIPVNITTALALWANILNVLSQLMLPFDDTSVLLPCLISNNLTSLRISYYGIFTNDTTTPNSPARDFWTLYIIYNFQNATQTQYLPISYLPTGELDLEHTTTEDIAKVTSLFSPFVESIASLTGDNSLDIFMFLNFMMLSSYWLTLTFFGQTAPTTYILTSQGTPNFSEPVILSSNNNIFVNNTLFQIYSSYLHETIMPLLQTQWPGAALPPFLPLSEQNSLDMPSSKILRNYTCSGRQMKGWVSVVISVITADYAILGGAYNFFIYVASWLQTRRGADENTRAPCEGKLEPKVQSEESLLAVSYSKLPEEPN